LTLAQEFTMKTRNAALFFAVVPATAIIAAEPPADTNLTQVTDDAPPIPPIVAYVNCDQNDGFPMINILDLACFVNKAKVGDTYANCDGSTIKPFITANDFTCFINAFVVASEWERINGPISSGSR
jgi:hypothetical protein